MWPWDPKKSWLPMAKGRLGQVVIAGHGSEHGVEMSSPGTGAWADQANNRVGYDQQDIDRSDSKKNGTELLFKTVIERMDPADVNIVFAGCLVNSHEIPATTKVSSNAKVAQKNLQDALKKHPNLAEYVRAQMAAMGAKGTVTADGRQARRRHACGRQARRRPADWIDIGRDALERLDGAAASDWLAAQARRG